MKLLRVVASNFKNCCDNFTIDFVAKSRKTSEDKEYELQAIADDLYLFNRQDNIWISTANRKVSLSNMYDNYDLRPERPKSKQFYNNVFQTSVNYEDLMRLKKELMHA